MRFTRFSKLRKALANLDVNFLSRQVARIDKVLLGHGLEFSPKNVAVTQEGIFYIDEDSGLTAKVIIYTSDDDVPLMTPLPRRKKRVNTPYEDIDVIEGFHHYHLLRCNMLTRSETEGWKQKFRVTQRVDGKFYYRLMRQSGGSGEGEVFQEIEDQKLHICPNCLLKVNSLLEGVRHFERESFEPKYFFDIDFARAWCRYAPHRENEFLADINPADWQRITDIRKTQVRYQCESCHLDLSNRALRKYLSIHGTNHSLSRVAYVKLECLCLVCLAEQPRHAHLKDTADYQALIGQFEYPLEDGESQHTTA